MGVAAAFEERYTPMRLSAPVLCTPDAMGIMRNMTSHPTDPPPIRGRGAAENPSSRFDTLEYLPADEARTADDPGPDTCFYADGSRSIIAHNESPDVGFDYSVNPYRGCEHGCIYCLDGETPILLADGSTRPLRALAAGDEIYGTRRIGRYRRLVRTRVLAHWSTRKPAFRITLGDGTTLIASADHRFLTDRGWKFVTGAEQGRSRRPHLTTNNKLMGTGRFAEPPARTSDYSRGYLCGMIRGDGLLASYEYDRPGRVHGNQWQFRLALADPEPLRRAEALLRRFGVRTHAFAFSVASPGSAPMRGIRTHARDSVERIERLVAWPASPGTEWYRGFLAGVFDAEGSFSDGVLRITNSDPAIIARVEAALRRLRFAFVHDRPRRPANVVVRTVRLLGGLREHLRFFHATGPAIARKRGIAGTAIKFDGDLRVMKIERLRGEMPLYDITTGTGDFIANGVVSHNCYARPTHEYLGFSAGLDFESRILVKRDAPALLREALMKPGWTPNVIAMSGVTDPYQPVERRLRLTRGCLEVLAEFRNPVMIITKNHLVTRDADVLSELAAHDAAVVNVSVTTLRNEIQRVMEPRTAVPARRLDAIETLAEAGVPVRVLVGPVIPGLTEHELPAIIRAAADVGAGSAGYIMLRLPHGVSELFERWLERHFPDRKDKVMNRVREIRGGRANDPRFHSRMSGRGIFAEQIRALFRTACRQAGLDTRARPELSTAAFRRPGEGRQLGLFTEGTDDGRGRDGD